MINIAIVHSVAKIGGAERVSQMIMNTINAKDFKCHLVCPESGSLEQWANEHKISFSK